FAYHGGPWLSGRFGFHRNYRLDSQTYLLATQQHAPRPHVRTDRRTSANGRNRASGEHRAPQRAVQDRRTETESPARTGGIAGAVRNRGAADFGRKSAADGGQRNAHGRRRGRRRGAAHPTHRPESPQSESER